MLQTQTNSMKYTASMPKIDEKNDELHESASKIKRDNMHHRRRSTDLSPVSEILPQMPYIPDEAAEP